MAGEKVNKSTRVVKRPTTKEKAETEPVISMTASQLQDFMSEAFKNAMGQVNSVPQGAKKELETNLHTTLTSRINKRNKEGQNFDNYLADPNGPRMRIVVDKIYAEYTSKSITATVNGNTVKVPADGKPHYVHPAHYAAIKNKLEYISATRERAVEGPDMFGNEVGDFQKVGQ